MEKTDNMAEARRNMHKVRDKKERDKKSKVKRVKNFFFGCCKDKT